MTTKKRILKINKGSTVYAVKLNLNKIKKYYKTGNRNK